MPTEFVPVAIAVLPCSGAIASVHNVVSEWDEHVRLASLPFLAEPLAADGQSTQAAAPARLRLFGHASVLWHVGGVVVIGRFS